MSKPFLILQLRPEDEPADNEFDAFLKFGRIDVSNVHRIRLERECLPPDLDLNNYSAVIVGGGPYNVSDEQATKPAEQQRFEAELDGLLAKVVANDIPYLGECSGLGFLARHLGASVSTEKYAEGVEATTITLSDAGQQDPLLQGLPSEFRAFAGHKESVQALPPQAVLLGSSQICPIHIIRVKQNIYATQFHPELDSEGLAVRIRYYRHKGYFKPEDADSLIEAGNRETVTVPKEILRRFVTRYNR